MTSPTPASFTDAHYEDFINRLYPRFLDAFQDTLSEMHEETGVEVGSIQSLLAALACITASMQCTVTEALVTDPSTRTTPREYSEYFLHCVNEALKLHYETREE